MTEVIEAWPRGKRARWHIEPPAPQVFRESLPGLSPMLSHLLYCRGVQTPEAVEAFFSGSAVSHDALLLPDMELLVDRLRLAAERGETVAVFGDFDCDGLTAAAVLVEGLRAIGLDPLLVIPERGDGHGINTPSLHSLAARGVTLVLTGDCGITAIEEVRAAAEVGIDVLITDHHEPRPDGTLPACPVVAPTRLDSIYPWRGLCGVGVAYKVVQALAARIPGALDPDDVLDLVALGTVADVAALRDENRALVVRGIERLRRTERPGILALLQVAGVRREEVNADSIAFFLAPRLNVANRLAQPQLAYDLLTATDPTEALTLAERLDGLNARRQALVTEQLMELLSSLGDPEMVARDVMHGRRAPVLIAVGEWQSGISGLLAAKLVDAYGLPAFVGSRGSNGEISMSGRGIAGIAIDEILERCDTLLPAGTFLGYGGHAGAGGFRVCERDLDAVTAALEGIAGLTVPVEDIGPLIRIDAEVGAAQITMDAARALRLLEPYGSAFTEPLFLLRGALLVRLTLRGNGRHAAFTIRRDGTALTGIFFGADPDFLALRPGTVLDLVFHLRLNEWNGNVKPELRLRDWMSRPLAA
jgi:single-stranded-DNA-specific exonuclease